MRATHKALFAGLTAAIVVAAALAVTPQLVPSQRVDSLSWASAGGRYWDVTVREGSLSITCIQPWPLGQTMSFSSQTIFVGSRAGPYPLVQPPISLIPGKGAGRSFDHVVLTGPAPALLSVDHRGAPARYSSGVTGTRRVSYWSLSILPNAPRHALVWMVPVWALLVTRSLVRWVRFRRATRRGRCRRCGYDLRASPERCPECGLPVAPPGPRQVNHGAAS